MKSKHVEGPPVTEHDLTVVIAARLRAKATQDGGTLERLADFAGVEPDLLNAIARGERAPSIDLLWKIANALGVPFGSLIATPRRSGAVVIRKSEDNVLVSSGGAFKSRSLTAFGRSPRVEIYELTLAPDHVEQSQAHAPGTSEYLVITHGAVEIVTGREPPYPLNKGDAIHFDADVPHSYRNIGEGEATAHLVLAYEDFRNA